MNLLRFLCVSLVLAGCVKDAEELEDPVLAQVGDRRITASQLIDFEQRLPAQLKSKKSGLDGYRDYLQTIIDKEIFVQEALNRGLDETPEVAQKLAREKAERVLRLLFEREFLAKVHVDEQELRAAYEAADPEREVKLRLIIVATQQEAEAIRQSLADGRDFAELALSRSLHQSTAPHGGELDGYLTANRIPIYLQPYINALAVGEYSEPIGLPNGQFGIYQVMFARPVSFATASHALEAKLREEKTTALIEAFLAQLRTDTGLQANAETLRWLQQQVAAGRREFSAAERAEELFQFRAGRVTVGDFWHYADELQMGFSGDIAESVRWFAEDVLLPRALFLHVAYKRGLDREEPIARWEQRRKDALLLLALRQTAVKDQVHIEPEAVRNLYDERPELFTTPEEVALQEIMVQTRAEAVALKERVEAGEPMGPLADEHTLRAVGKGAQGQFHIHAFEQSFYRELIDAVRNAEVGGLYGPLAVTAQAAQVVGPGAMPRGGEYYSVFRVLESNFGRAPEPFDTAAKRARALLKRAEESRLADEFLRGLRRDYDARVVVYEDRLETVLPR